MTYIALTPLPEDENLQLSGRFQTAMLRGWRRIAIALAGSLKTVQDIFLVNCESLHSFLCFPKKKLWGHIVKGTYNFFWPYLGYKRTSFSLIY